MKPASQRIALLMSLAGVGLSVTAQAEAARAPHARRISAHGLPTQAAGTDFCASSTPDAIPLDIRRLPSSSPLQAVDEALLTAAREAFDTQDVDAVRFAISTIPVPASSGLSRADRDAIALAMVADPDALLKPAETPSPTPDSPFPNEPVTLGALAAIPLRQPEDPPVSIETLEQTHTPRNSRRNVIPPERASESPPIDVVAKVDRAAEVDIVRAGGTVAAVSLSTLDIELDLELTPGPVPNFGLPIGPGLDLNLDLAADLDLNLDHASSVDVPLDFAPEANRPSDTARVGSSIPDLAVDLDLGLDFLLDLKSGRTWKAPSAPAASAHVSPPVSRVATAARKSPTTVADIPAVPVALPEVSTRSSSVRAAESSCVADDPPTAAKPAPQIVVATHAERVMLSLEALVRHEDPTALRFGAQTDITFAASHAEKTLLTLASLRNRNRNAPLPSVGSSAEHSLATENSDEDRPETHSLQPGVGSPAVAVRPPAPTESGKALPGRPLPPVRSPLGIGLLAVNGSKLDQVRGGFQTPSGVQVAFGIERAVYINGNLVTTTSLNVSEAGKITTGQTTPPLAGNGLSSAVRDGTTVIQNGVGNIFLSGPVSAASLGTVVQNTLNDQKIQSVTLVNATVNSLQVLKAQTLQSSLRSALIDSLRR